MDPEHFKYDRSSSPVVLRTHHLPGDLFENTEVRSDFFVQEDEPAQIIPSFRKKKLEPKQSPPPPPPPPPPSPIPRPIKLNDEQEVDWGGDLSNKKVSGFKRRNKTARMWQLPATITVPEELQIKNLLDCVDSGPPTCAVNAIPQSASSKAGDSNVSSTTLYSSTLQNRHLTKVLPLHTSPSGHFGPDNTFRPLEKLGKKRHRDSFYNPVSIPTISSQSVIDHPEYDRDISDMVRVDDSISISAEVRDGRGCGHGRPIIHLGRRDIPRSNLELHMPFHNGRGVFLGRKPLEKLSREEEKIFEDAEDERERQRLRSGDPIIRLGLHNSQIDLLANDADLIEFENKMDANSFGLAQQALHVASRKASREERRIRFAKKSQSSAFQADCEQNFDTVSNLTGQSTEDNESYFNSRTTISSPFPDTVEDDIDMCDHALEDSENVPKKETSGRTTAELIIENFEDLDRDDSFVVYKTTSMDDFQVLSAARRPEELDRPTHAIDGDEFVDIDDFEEPIAVVDLTGEDDAYELIIHNAENNMVLNPDAGVADVQLRVFRNTANLGHLDQPSAYKHSDATEGRSELTMGKRPRTPALSSNSDKDKHLRNVLKPSEKEVVVPRQRSRPVHCMMALFPHEILEDLMEEKHGGDGDL